MSEAIFTIKRAATASLQEVFSVLDKVGLPRDGITENIENFLIAIDGTGAIKGCVGLEPYANIGLLRSLAVHPDCQGQRLGTRLTYAVLDLASEHGLTEVVLLTTTANVFFAKLFGFRVARRSRYKGRLMSSAEWNLPYSSSAVFMKLPIT